MFSTTSGRTSTRGKPLRSNSGSSSSAVPLTHRQLVLLDAVTRLRADRHVHAAIVLVDGVDPARQGNRPLARRVPFADAPLERLLLVVEHERAARLERVVEPAIACSSCSRVLPRPNTPEQMTVRYFRGGSSSCRADTQSVASGAAARQRATMSADTSQPSMSMPSRCQGTSSRPFPQPASSTGSRRYGRYASSSGASRFAAAHQSAMSPWCQVCGACKVTPSRWKNRDVRRRELTYT